MRYQLLPGAERDTRSGPGDRGEAPTDVAASGAAGAAGMRWLWGLVELRLLGEADPDTAA
jgi:hypothetical protein